MPYQAVLFDLDGTLVDTLTDLRNSTNRTLESYGWPTRSMDEIRSFVGNGTRRLMELAVPEGVDGSLFEEVFARFSEDYAQNCTVDTAPYAGICELLADLRGAGVAVGVVSNKPEPQVLDVIQGFFPGIVDKAIGVRPDLPRKPAPDMLFWLADALNCPVENAVMVGDSEVDVAIAKNANIRFIGVTWGFRTKEELLIAGSSCNVDSVAKLRALLF